MARNDYYDDPKAPRANSLVVAASAIVEHEGKILLQRRSDNNLWALPGGGVEIGESVGDAIIREVREETGISVTPQYVISVYSDPKHVMEYDNGEVRQEFSICIACAMGGGELAVSSESKEVGWFDKSTTKGMNMHPRIYARIQDYLDGVVAKLNP